MTIETWRRVASLAPPRAGARGQPRRWSRPPRARRARSPPWRCRSRRRSGRAGRCACASRKREDRARRRVVVVVEHDVGVLDLLALGEHDVVGRGDARPPRPAPRAESRERGLVADRAAVGQLDVERRPARGRHRGHRRWRRCPRGRRDTSSRARRSSASRRAAWRAWRRSGSAASCSAGAPALLDLGRQPGHALEQLGQRDGRHQRAVRDRARRRRPPRAAASRRRRGWCACAPGPPARMRVCSARVKVSMPPSSGRGS